MFTTITTNCCGQYCSVDDQQQREIQRQQFGSTRSHKGPLYGKRVADMDTHRTYSGIGGPARHASRNDNRWTDNLRQTRDGSIRSRIFCWMEYLNLQRSEKQDKYGLKMKKLNICQSITRDNWKNKYLWRRKRNEDVNASADPTVEGEEDTEKIKQYQTELRRVPHSGKHTLNWSLVDSLLYPLNPPHRHTHTRWRRAEK